MLTVSSVAGGGAGYYMSKDNYYFLGNMESRWMGELAVSLGLEGQVQAQDFEQALAGQFPGGIDLSRMSGGKNTHRPGYDLTLSAPKSISVLGVVMGDSRILDAHQRAVSVAMGEIERLASTRIMTEGVSETVLTGKLLAAAFNHDTSRELDPQLHTHLIILNLTEHNGEWKTLSSDRAGKTGFIENVYALQVALGKIYRNELRQIVEEMGFRTVATGKNDLWEIEGVPVEIFSQRSQQIREAVGDDASLKSRDVAALDTRKAKQKNPDKVALLTEWMNRLEQEGFDFSALKQEALARQQQESESPLRAETTPADVRQAVNDAISLLSEKRTRFTFSDVLNRTLNSLDAREQIVVQARQAINEAIESQQLIPLDREKGVFTSSIHLLDELSLQQLAGRMRDEIVVGAGGVNVAAGSLPEALVNDRPPVAIIRQPGGAAAMREGVLAAAALADGQGRDVRVLATDSCSARFLSEQTALAGRVITLKNLTDEALPEGGTLIVAGAEKLSVRDALTVTDQALRSQSQMLLMDGGGRSGTGNALQTLEDAGVTRLQAGAEPQVAVSVVSLADKRQRYSALAQEYATLSRQGDGVVAQASGEREQRALSADIRQALREQGLLGEKAVTVSALIPQWLDSKNRRQLDTYREGMVLEHRDPDRRTPVRYTIDRVSPATRSLTLLDDRGERQGLKLRDVDAAWSLYVPKAVEVAEGEKLTWRARQGKLRSGDSVTVTKIKKHALVVEHQGQTRVVPLTEAIKADHGYVTTPGSLVREQGAVLAAVAARDTGATMLNTLARSGDRVQIFTPLVQDEAERRLSRSPLYRTALAQVNPDKGELNAALDSARDSLMSPAEKAVRQAVSLTQGSEVVFSRPDVLANALPLHPSLRAEDVDREMARQVKAGELIPVPGPKGMAQQLYVTAASYEAEKQIIRLVAEGLGSQSPLMADAQRVLPAGLTEGQRQASRLILENTDRFVAIQGYAGVGKTTQLKAVLAALETLPAERRPDVVGLAPTHRAVGEMADVGVKAQTLASFLMDVERRTQSGETPDFSRTLFLVDESSMVGNRDFADAMTHIAAGGGRAVLSGDRDQLLPVSNGAPFTLLQERSPLDTAIMKDIVRQTPALKPAIYAMTERQVPAALETIRSVTPDVVPREAGRWAPGLSVMEMSQTAKQTEEQGDRVIQLIVDDFTGRTAEARAATLIVTQTNADKNAINAAIHERLQERGDLGREISITVLDRVKTHSDRLKSVAGMAEHHGKTALINDRYYTIRAGQDSQRNGYVELVGEDGRAQALSAFESSLRDVAVFEPRNITVSVGETVSFSRSDRERGREANSTWAVSAVTKEGEIHLTREDETRVINPRREMADRHLDYGYAGTAHKAQGASALYTIVLAGVEGSRQALASLRDAYVAFSRSKVHVQVYTDNLAKWLEKVSGPSERQTAHDVLLAADDRQAATAQGLWEAAKPLDETALGRALLEQIPDAGEARFISGSRKYPAPHVALPAYDAAGKLRAVMLREIQLDENGRLSGLSDDWRRLGSEAATLTVIRHSESGQTLTAPTPEAARLLARQYPEDGIVLMTGEAPVNGVIRQLTGGILPPDVPADNAAPPAADLPDPLSLKTPDEQRAERAMQEEARKQMSPERPLRVQEDVMTDDTEKTLARELQHNASREQQREIQILAQVQREERELSRDSVKEQLQRTEREIVREKEIGE
ncbi:conjugative transfer relaxase/helicase TraI [Pantoea agglomerans]|uniref:conjugative transfer relaxase/helicase TraI n=1 Tax=Enterobacter agglomerans TaxID=549 RepID=UPI00241333D9|nr:conjugative transfer relaxase/helicase TraI [Pantoea agglomerans]